MSSSGDSAPANSTEQRDETDISAHNSANHQEGSLTSRKHQLSSIASGNSLTQLPSQVSNIAADKLKEAKETALDDAVPAAAGAIQTVQDQVRYMTGQRKETGTIDQDNVAQADECECIERMDTERVSDFLREKHMSNVPTPRRS